MFLGAAGDDHRGAGLGGDPCGLELGLHAAARQMARSTAGHGLDGRRDLGHDGQVLRLGRAAGRRGVEAVDVGEQHQAVGLDHGGDAGAQAIIVAVADLGGGDAVVLVDDRHRAHGDQAVDGGAGVQIVAPLLGDVGGDEDLPGDDPERAEALFPGAAEGDLTDAGGRLALLEAEGVAIEAEDAPPEGDGAGGDEDDLMPGAAQRRDVGGEALQPGAPYLAAGAIDEQRRSDLDDDPPIGRQRLQGIGGACGERVHQGTQ
jgi:hypothetical protein